MHRLLLCPPDFYAVRYEINPWMDRARGVDRSLAEEQWKRLCNKLTELNCELKFVPPASGWPDLVFTANAGLVQGRRVLLSNFRHPERAGEEPVYKRWFREGAYEVTRLAPGQAFEGEGDALWFGNTLCCGHGFRTDQETHSEIAKWSRSSVLSLALVDPRYYHLDTCFCPLNATSALWHSQAFEDECRRNLRRIVPDLIEVPPTEAECFACNAIVLGRDVILPERSLETSRALQSRGFRTHAVPMSEFIKAGGACKCLVLRL